VLRLTTFWQCGTRSRFFSGSGPRVSIELLIAIRSRWARDHPVSRERRAVPAGAEAAPAAPCRAFLIDRLTVPRLRCPGTTQAHTRSQRRHVAVRDTSLLMPIAQPLAGSRREAQRRAQRAGEWAA
jgi:hypothetical protein